VSAADDGVFEVLRFAGQPATAETALVELEGRFPAGPPRRAPRLLIEPTRPGAEPVECSPAVAGAHGDGTWRASFAVPLELLEAGSYALAAEGVLLELPRPDVEAADGDADRLVRLAREANDLRRRLDVARAGRADAEARAERAEAELGVERGERAAAEQARDAEAGTVAALRAELEAERERLAGTEAGLRDELQADRERTDAEAAALREQLEAAQAEHAQALEAERERAGAEAAALREQLEAAAAERERMLEAERIERERAVEIERERGVRKVDEGVAAERARANQISHELRAARAENEALHRAAGTAPTRPGPPPPPEPEPQAEVAPPEERTETIPIAARHGAAAPEAAPAETETQAGETVRLLSPRPQRRRHSAADEPEDTTPAPGAAAAGARHIEPVAGSQELPIARILAVGALGLAVLIVLLLIVGKL
jgi:hypothetical protein